MAEIDELFAAIHCFVAANWPGRLPVRATIHLSDGAKIHLPVPPAPAPVAASPAEESSAGGENRFYRCMPDILHVLRESPQPLTGLRIKAALYEAGKEWSDRWVDEMLARMVRDGTLENPADARPRGYRLPANPGERES